MAGPDRTPRAPLLGLTAALAVVAAVCALWAVDRSVDEPELTESIEAAIPEEPPVRSGARISTETVVDPFLPEKVPTSPDAAAAETVEMLSAAVEFWEAFGSDDPAVAMAAVGPASGPYVTDHAGFVAELSPRFTADHCTRFATNAVACSLTVHNYGIVAAGISSPTALSLVTFRHGEVEWFDPHPAVTSASIRLAEFARAGDPAGFAAACRAATSGAGSPTISWTYDATPTCGSHLASLLDDYLATTLPASAR